MEAPSSFQHAFFILLTGNTVPRQRLTEERHKATKLMTCTGLNLPPKLYLFEDKIDGTAAVDVNEVNVGLLLQQLCASGHGVWVSSTDL